MGTLVKSLQFSYWMLWYCSFGHPDFWSSLRFYFSAESHSTVSEAHLSIGPVWLSWWPFTCLQYHISGSFIIIWSIADISSKWLERHEYLVFLSIAFFISLRRSRAIVAAPSRMLNFRLISSTMYTTCKMTYSSFLYSSWSLWCPGRVQEAAIWFVACSAHSMISAAEPQSSL